MTCTINISANPLSPDLPPYFTITVIDSLEYEFGRFNYPSYNGFIFEREINKIDLSSKQPRQNFDIKTPKDLKIISSESSKRWLKSSFDKEKSIQTVSIDMSG